MSDEPPYAGPPISRHVAGLLGIPLDDSDVEQEDGSGHDVGP